MISKKTFCEVMEAQKLQDDIDQNFGKALETVCDSWCLFGTMNKKYDALSKVLKEVLADEGDWISWWMYEKDYGTNKKIKAHYKNKKEIKLNTAEDLYDFLLETKAEKEKELKNGKARK